MFRKVGIAILQFLSMLAFLAGILTLWSAATLPDRYQLANASAVQVTEVYSVATFTSVLAVGYLLVALFIQIALYFGYPPKNQQITDLRLEVSEIKTMVWRIGALLQKRKEPKA